MNAVTQTVAAEPVSGVEIFVPLAKLKKSPRNARKVPHGEAAIEALAASIQHKGLIQNLVVEPETKEDGTPTGYYLVTAGEGRRLAMLLRAKRKQIKKSEVVRCWLDTANDPSEISLDENVTRTPILAIQLFITLIEFKLATLAGFVLIPFGLFGKTAFMAERVLGLVISSGVKVLVLAVIVGIGSTLFDEFRAGFGGAQPTIEDAMAVALASLCLLGLGIFGPSIANGIVSGGPALGAGAAAGTALAAGGALVGGAAAARLGAGAVAGAVGGAARGAAFTSGAANSAYALGSAGRSGAAAAAGGAAGVGRAAVGAATSPLRRAAASLKESYRSGGRAAVTATGGTISGGSASPAPEPSSGPPSWATAMKRRQTMTHGATVAAHTLRSGDGGGSGASVDVSQKD